jgi:hypothetical protein
MAVEGRDLGPVGQGVLDGDEMTPVRAIEVGLREHHPPGRRGAHLGALGSAEVVRHVAPVLVGGVAVEELQAAVARLVALDGQLEAGRHGSVVDG